MNTGIAASLSSNNEKQNYIGHYAPGLSPEELTMHIRRCSLNDRDSQKKIYTTFYSFSMAICRRYVTNCEEAIEILNDGFLKIFKDIHRYQPAYADVVGSFREWIRKTMEYSAIDHFRRDQKYRFNSGTNDGAIHLPDISENVLDKISYQEILDSMGKLTPVYRTVLNLFIIEGWTHQEIAAELGISVGTSKSNLSKARIQLQKILFRRNEVEGTKEQSDVGAINVINAKKSRKYEQVIGIVSAR